MFAGGGYGGVRVNDEGGRRSTSAQIRFACVFAGFGGVPAQRNYPSVPAKVSRCVQLAFVGRRRAICIVVMFVLPAVNTSNLYLFGVFF